MLNAVALGNAIVSKVGLPFHLGSSTDASNKYTDQVATEVSAGDQNALDALVGRAGYAGGPGAPGTGGPFGDAKSYAQSKLDALVKQGLVKASLSGVPLNRDRGVQQFPDLPYDNPNLVGKFTIAAGSGGKNVLEQGLGGAATATGLPGWVIVVGFVAGAVLVVMNMRSNRAAAAA